jgi:membrane-bound metal-dependent hydrolase YbcI (DUF457 family)
VTDLLTHVLAAYVLATLAVWRLDGVRPRHVPLAMVGAGVPDVAKVYFVLGGIRHTVAGVEISLLALQTLGVAVAFALVGGVLVTPEERRVALPALLGGVGLHVVLDYFVVRTGGYVPPYLYPVTWAELPAVNVYLSSDVWPSVLAGTAAVAVWGYGRWRSSVHSP